MPSRHKKIFTFHIIRVDEAETLIVEFPSLKLNKRYGFLTHIIRNHTPWLGDVRRKSILGPLNYW